MKAQKNALEWTVFAISALIFVALVGYLAVEATRRGPSGLHIEVTTGSAQRQGDFWAVPVTMSNHGEQTAEQLNIEVALLEDGREVEVTEVDLAFLPRRSERHAWALFRNDPRELEIVARAVSFKEP